MKLSKSIALESGAILVKGTELVFSDGATAMYAQETVNILSVPTIAIEAVAGTIVHDTLHQSFWQDMQFDETIRERLVTIARDFYESLKLPAPIIDIQLTGSIANYNYHDLSDLDVHVIIDYTVIDDNVDLVKKMINAERWKWNETYDIMFRGHEVELYIQDVSEQHTASGLYSLLNAAWIIEPSPKTMTIDENDVTYKANLYKSMIDTLIAQKGIADAKNLYERATTLRYKIIRLRRDAFEAGENEFNIDNLAFKELRNSGYIGKLIDFEHDVYEKSFELNE